METLHSPGYEHSIFQIDSRHQAGILHVMKTKSNRSRVMACAPLLVVLLGSLTGCSLNSKSAGAGSRDTPAKPINSKHSSEASGILPLASGTDAFVARLALAGKAQRTLDLQYYIWHGDQTGKLLAGAVVQAAERGVKARLLLDDMGAAANDRSLLILDSHPNVEVRLFNPIGLRSHRMLGTLLDFKRVNRRMHNKTFTVDGRVAIIGGRNIGDEYFGAAELMNHSDFDVVTKGPVVREVAASFESYWNCPAAVPISKVSKERVSEADIQRGMQELLAHREMMEKSPYAKALRSSKLATTPLSELRLLKGQAMVVADDPEKVTRSPDDASTHLAPQLRGIVDGTKKEVLLVSPYFVPGKEGTEWFARMRQRGVAVTLITNTLAATDVAAVHSGYTRYRKTLLQDGVVLYETKSEPPAPGEKTHFSMPSLSLTGSSKASLHAKTFVFDRRWVFVGSMNLDPRSLKLNTEIGMIVDCPELAEEMLRTLASQLPERAYRVELGSGGLTWTSQEDGKTVTLKSEPPAGFTKRLIWRIASMLPIEGQL